MLHEIRLDEGDRHVEFQRDEGIHAVITRVDHTHVHTPFVTHMYIKSKTINAFYAYLFVSLSDTNWVNNNKIKR